ncbi:interleukin-10 receptor subunit beta isoform X7 [Rattus norvegicus]|uniref:interleukin-10 receptor subunit beta isoform X7 n=1 Tax=Rattus norvegicus TaxID=10116 RepID=UPI002FD7DA0A
MAWAPSVAGWLGGFLLVPALGMIPPPENVRMNSVNFKNILQWEVPAFPKENLTFTAQYESYWYFQDRCKNTASTHCDFSVLSKYGDHTVRVRTELADEHSEWVNVTFCPVEDTIIGPPEMQTESLADSIHMRFSAPQIENEPETWTMKNIYNSWAYRVQYWKNGTKEKGAVILKEIYYLYLFMLRGMSVLEIKPPGRYKPESFDSSRDNCFEVKA